MLISYSISKKSKIIYISEQYSKKQIVCTQQSQLNTILLERWKSSPSSKQIEHLVGHFWISYSFGLLTSPPNCDCKYLFLYFK